jgi:hypothetical protein
MSTTSRRRRRAEIHQRLLRKRRHRKLAIHGLCIFGIGIALAVEGAGHADIGFLILAIIAELSE